MQKIFLLLFVSTILVSCTSRKKKMIGTWVQPDLIPTVEGFGKYDSIIFSDQTFEWYMHICSDPRTKKKIFTLKSTGTWSCTGRNKKDVSYTDYILTFKNKSILLLDTIPQAMDNYYLRICYLTLGVETDISETGCAAIPPISVMKNIYQTCNIIDDKLYNGEYHLHELPSTPLDRPSKTENIPLIKLKN